jgi:hypothetical protein
MSSVSQNKQEIRIQFYIFTKNKITPTPKIETKRVNLSLSIQKRQYRGVHG